MVESFTSKVVDIMSKYLAKIKIFAPLLPPVGDIPDDLEKYSIESFIWGKGDTNEEIRILLPRPIKKTDKISSDDSIVQFYYVVEIIVFADAIEDAASRSIYLLEQVLDTSSLYSQATSKIVNLLSIVNLSQIEEILRKKSGSFEKGLFKTYRLQDIKAFPPGRLVFLTDQGAKKIGRNLFWFRRGLIELSSLNRFTSFYTAFSQLHEYFKELTDYRTNQKPLIFFVEQRLKFPKDTFKKWSDLRSRILHYGNKQDDFQKLNNEARASLTDIYKATYYGIMQFITDNPPAPGLLLFFDDLEKEIVEATPDVISRLQAISDIRNTGYKEIILSS